MKKLLALILCVMMFVAIIPTAAFAAVDPKDPDQVAEAARLDTEAQNAREAAEKAEEKMTEATTKEETAKNEYTQIKGEYDSAVDTLVAAKRAYEIDKTDDNKDAVSAAQAALDAIAPSYNKAKATYEKAMAASDTAIDNYKVAQAAADVAFLEFQYYVAPSATIAERLAEAEAAYEALVSAIIPVDSWKVVGDALTGYYSTAINADAISDLKDSIENMFNGLAVNQAVFGTAQTLHNLADGMVKDLLADVDDYDALDGTTVGHDDLVTNCRAFLKSIIGTQIESYVDKRAASFMNDDGTVDYKNYLNVYTKAVNDAVNSSKAQKGIEAFVYAVTALKMQDAINDKTDDLKDEITAWNDFGSKWSEFGFSQDVDDLFDLIGGPVEDYTFVVPTGLTVDEALTLDAILNP